MKNLYIYTLDGNNNLNKQIWEDIKITRNKGQIVTKKNSDYRLTHSFYKLNDNIDRVRIIGVGFPIIKVSHTEYITFDETELSEDIKKQMREPFIERYNNEINELQNKIIGLEKLRNKFIVNEEE